MNMYFVLIDIPMLNLCVLHVWVKHCVLPQTEVKHLRGWEMSNFARCGKWRWVHSTCQLEACWEVELGCQRNSIDRLPSKLHSGIYQPQDLQIFTYHDIPAFKHLFLIRSWIETVIFPCCFSIFWRSWLWHYFKFTKNWWAPIHNIKICSFFRGTSELFHKGIKEHIHSLSTLICR